MLCLITNFYFGIYLFISCCIYWTIYSCINAFIYVCACISSYSFYLCMHLYFSILLSAFIYWFIDLFIYLFLYSCIHSCVYLFIYVFTLHMLSSIYTGKGKNWYWTPAIWACTLQVPYGFGRWTWLCSYLFFNIGFMNLR